MGSGHLASENWNEISNISTDFAVVKSSRVRLVNSPMSDSKVGLSRIAGDPISNPLVGQMLTGKVDHFVSPGAVSKRANPAVPKVEILFQF